MSASAPSDLESLKASLAAYDAQIKELTEKKQVIERQLNRLVTIPNYINYIIKTLKGHFGPSNEWESAVRTALTENLTSKPFYRRKIAPSDPGFVECFKGIEYDWNDKKVIYGIVSLSNQNLYGDAEDDEDTPSAFYQSNDPTEPRLVGDDGKEIVYDHQRIYSDYADRIREMCISIYNEKKWEKIETFNMKYIPILAGYINKKIERIDEL